jgi:acylphosphatase
LFLKMIIARRCTVHGRVQGVGFRYFVVAEAGALKVGGYVRNLIDGAVEAVIEGEESPVLTLVDRIREGPRWSRVEDMQVEVLRPSGKFTRFQITG